MKKLLFTIVAGAALLMNTATLSAQNYKTGLGLAVDFGSGTTFVGPHIKHFFSPNAAINGEILFGGSTSLIQAMYQYHGNISGASGLKWYIGGGPSLQLYDGGSSFYLVPMAGLDLKFSGAPISASFDWRPRAYLGDNPFIDNFNAGRFGLGFRYNF